jgi:hypothetical protein
VRKAPTSTLSAIRFSIVGEWAAHAAVEEASGSDLLVFAFGDWMDWG